MLSPSARKIAYLVFLLFAFSASWRAEKEYLEGHNTMHDSHLMFCLENLECHAMAHGVELRHRLDHHVFNDRTDASLF